jgi:hypothetical protein
VIKPRAEALGAAKSPEACGAIVSELKVRTLVESAGFVAIFTCMILMCFDH